MGLLLLDIPSHELYVRLLIAGCFLIFGAIVSNLVRKIEGAEKSLREANETMEALLNATTDMVMLLDTEGAVRLINKPGARFLGKSRTELVGRSIFELLPTGVAETRREKLREVVRAGLPVQFEDSSEGIHLENSWFPVLGDNGIKRIAVFARDITTRRRAEDARDRLFNLSLDMMCVAGFDGYFKQVNPAYGKILGWSREDLLGKPWLEFIHPQDVQKTVRAGTVLAAGEVVRSLENRFQCKDGSYRWLSWNSFPLLSEMTIFSITRDITEQKRAGRSLKRSEAQLASIFRAAPTGIGMGSNRFITWVNDRLCEMTGYERDELLHQEGRMLYPTDEDYEYVGKEKYAQISRHGTGTVETRWQRKDGRIIDVLLSSTPIDLADLSAGVTFTALDITERKRAEQALRESEEKFRNIVESSPLGMLMYQLHPDGVLELVGSNPAADEILGMACSRLVGKAVEDAFPTIVETEVPQRFRLAASDSIPWHNSRFQYGSGEIQRVYEVHAFQTSPGRMVAAFADVSDRVVAEQKLNEYKEHLEDLVEERTKELRKTQEELVRKERLAVLGQLTATVSHEIRNPLGTVRTSVFSIADAIERNEMHRISRAIRLAERNIVRCDRIIEELLDFTRVKEINPRPTPIDSWLEETLREQAIPDAIDLMTDLNSGAMIVIDRDRMRRAVINVVTNAIQALEDKNSPGNTLRVVSSVEGKWLELRVEDTGTGMSKDVSTRIFEPLFSTKGFGVGLGLPIVKSTLEQHGGEVRIASREGRGTSVILRLPISRSNEEQ